MKILPPELLQKTWSCRYPEIGPPYTFVRCHKCPQCKVLDNVLKEQADAFDEIKGWFDEQAISQDDVLESNEWEHEGGEFRKKSVIIWSTLSTDEESYVISVQFRYYDENDQIPGDDEDIESFSIKTGTTQDDLEQLNNAIECFIENGGKKSNFKFLF